MDDTKHSVAVSDHRREFIEEELAAGAYASEAEVVDAALELLERSKKVGVLRALIAEADDQFERGDYREFGESDDLTQYIVDNAESLRR
jgi:antitoxin ParD1/3/4